MTRTCPKCGIEKPKAQFFRNKRTAHGCSIWCKACDKVYHAAYYQDHKVRLDEQNREYVEVNSDKVRRYRRQWNREAYMNSARRSLGTKLYAALKRRPTENPVTLDELEAMYDAQEGRCALTGVVMTRLAGRMLPTSLSLDRINQDGLYTRDNVRLVCQGINAFKGVGTDEEMFALAEALLRRNRPEILQQIMAA